MKAGFEEIFSRLKLLRSTQQVFRSFLFALVSMGAMAAPAIPQDQTGASVADLQKELSSWQQKIKDMQDRVAKEESTTADEVNAFRAYLQTEASHKAELQAQVDSLSSDIAAEKKRVDSLEKSADNRKLSSQTADNRVEELRLALLAACNDLKDFYNSLPPSNIKSSSATLDFLKGELESKAVPVSEAIERYWQILSVLDDAESSLDTYAGASPLASSAGQVYFVRIGLSYLAFVGEEGKSAYLWSSDKGGSWQQISDQVAKTALWDAVRIRDRKIVPRIVGLPFDNPVNVRTVDGKNSDKRGTAQ